MNLWTMNCAFGCLVSSF